jgi:tetratricopeptide (TPR) repeat protein
MMCSFRLLVIAFVFLSPVTICADSAEGVTATSPTAGGDGDPRAEDLRFNAALSSDDSILASEDEHAETANDTTTSGEAFAWDQARFLLDQGKILYNSWTCTDAGMAQFQAALEMIAPITNGESKYGLLSEAYFWMGLAQLKLNQFEQAAGSFTASIQSSEEDQGHYADATLQAYLGLSKALSDAGETPASVQAAKTAARIEFYAEGHAQGPTRARELLQRTLKTEYGYSPEDTRKIWSSIEESVSLEITGDELLTLDDDPEGAYAAYREAARLERKNWGNTGSNVELPRLLRKAAMALLNHPPAGFQTDLLMEAFLQNLKPDEKIPFLFFLNRGDKLSRKGDIAGATDAYSQAIRSIRAEQSILDSNNTDWSPELSINTLQFLFVLLCGLLSASLFSLFEPPKDFWPTKWLQKQWSEKMHQHFTDAMIWFKAKMTQFQETLKKPSAPISSSSGGPEKEHQRPAPTTSNVSKPTIPSVDEPGQEILPSADGTDADDAHTPSPDDIGSSGIDFDNLGSILYEALHSPSADHPQASTRDDPVKMSPLVG